MRSDIPSTTTVFGIRHHGPGSARSLVRSLQSLSPDIILVEGPPEADGTLSLLAEADMQPPVALLIYPPDHLQHSAYYPFAVFSPPAAILVPLPVRRHGFPKRSAVAASRFAGGTVCKGTSCRRNPLSHLPHAPASTGCTFPVLAPPCRPFVFEFPC